jgi:hypothetical protein
MRELSSPVFQNVIFHAAWLLPLLLGAITLGRLRRSDDPSERVVHRSFGAALVVVGAGYVGAYSNWRLLVSQVASLQNVDWSDVKVGVARSVLPALVSIAVALLLWVFASRARGQSQS